MARAHSGRDSALSPTVRLGTEAEAQEGPRRIQLAPCKAGILALLQPLRLLLPPPGMWGWQWAVPATLLRSLLTPDSREYDGRAPTSHFVYRHNVLSCGEEGWRDRVVAWWLLQCHHGPSPWLHWFEGLLQSAPTLAVLTVSRSDCFWKTDMTLLTVPLFLPSCPWCGLPSLGGFSWCSPASHPDPGGRFVFTPNQTQSAWQ